MRLVFVGASPIAVTAARMLTAAGYDAVIIDKNAEKLDRLGEELDCGLVNDDGSRPAVLREVGPESTDLLFCLSDDDQDNLIASLVGRELGFRRVVTKIEDLDYEPICRELGLDDPIVPSQRIAENLVDLAEGRETAGLSTVIQGGLRFFAFVVDEENAGPLSALDLDARARVVAITRDDCSTIPDDDSTLEVGDEVALIVHEDDLSRLGERLGTDRR